MIKIFDINLNDLQYCKFIKKQIIKTESGCSHGDCKHCPYRKELKN